jgi:hypothetical protein
LIPGRRSQLDKPGFDAYERMIASFTHRKGNEHRIAGSGHRIRQFMPP